MKLARVSIVLVVALWAALVATISRANEDTKSNPYESIATRNPFQLKDPPPPPDPNEVAKPPPPQLATVEVTGVMNMLSKKKVLLEIVPGPGKPPIKPTLEEGERVESVEVLFIDVDNSEVRINNGGVITNIALKTPAKAPSGPVPGIQPGIPLPGMPNPTAAIVPPTVNPGAAGANGAYNNNARGNVMVVGGTPATSATAPNASGITAKPNYGALGAGAQSVGSPTYAPAYNNAGSGVNVSGGGANPNVGSGVNVSGGGDVPRTIPTRPIRTQSTEVPPGVQNDPVKQYLDLAIQEQQLKYRGIQPPPLPHPPGVQQLIEQGK